MPGTKHALDGPRHLTKRANSRGFISWDTCQRALQNFPTDSFEVVSLIQIHAIVLGVEDVAFLVRNFPLFNAIACADAADLATCDHALGLLAFGCRSKLKTTEKRLLVKPNQGHATEDIVDR